MNFQNFPIRRHSRESGNPDLDARLRGHDAKKGYPGLIGMFEEFLMNFKFLIKNSYANF
ncbi:MAG: hypothetical protein HY401_07300 [Elusimicrobia bacterium]|nr:hypothetical protein [Elusimicrobiota bacterium]